jgi:hypothetical protein
MKPFSPVSTNVNIAVQKIKNSRVVLFFSPPCRKSETAKSQIPGILGIVSALLFSDFCIATSIVAIRTPDYIIIGSDSAGTFEIDSGPSSVRKVCKILQDGNMFVATSGVFDDPISGFNVDKIVVAASKAGGSIRRRAELSARELLRVTPAEMFVLKTIDPNRYQTMISGKTDFLAVLFFGLEKGIPVAIGVGIRTMLSPKGRIIATPKWSSCPSSDCPHGVLAFYLGSHEAIDAYMAALKNKDIGDRARNNG